MDALARRLRGSLTGLAVSLFLTGCVGQGDGTLEVVSRFIEREPTATFGQSGPLTTNREVFVWSGDSPEEATPWTSTRRRRPGTGDETDTLTFRRPTDLVAADVAWIEVRVSGAGLSRNSAVLLWTRDGGPRTGEESLNTRGKMTADGTGHVFRFGVAGHPQWRGAIGRLSIRLFAKRDAAPRLDGLTAGTRVFSEEGLADAIRGFRIELDDEVRSSLLALPGVDIERRLDLPRGARLSLAWGVHGSPGGAVRFQVLGSRESAEPSLLFESTVEADTDVGRWHSAEVDLSTVIGRSSSLILRTSIEGPFDRAAGFPVWGHPVVVAPPGGGRAAEPRPNVVLISADTLRADRLSLYGHDRPTTPGLEAWAAGSATVFLDTVAPTPWTLPSHVSLLTGLDAHRHGVVRQAAPLRLETLAETLHAAGYTTAAITGGGYLHPSFGLSQGFDRYRFDGGRNPANRRPPTEDTTELDKTVARAVNLLDEIGDRPFFLFLHTFETHQPFLAREPWFSRFSRLPPPREPLLIPRVRAKEEEGFRHYKPMDLETEPGVDPVELLQDVYDSSVAHLDDRLHRFLSALAEKGLSDRTIVVFTSDHGELLGERGLASHYYLWEENILVPLVISAPGRTSGGQRVEEQVRLIDVHPTLLELAGLPVPEGLDGVSLVPLLEGRGGEPREALTYAAASNQGIAVRLGGHTKYVYDNTAWPPHAGTEAGYSLGPAGETDLPTAELDRFSPLRETLLRRLQEEAPGLDLHLVNRGDDDMRGTAAGPSIETGSVKAIELPCDCVSWDGPGRLAFRVPPGDRIVLKVEGLTRSGLRVRIAGGADGVPAALDEWLEPPSDGTPIQVTLTGSAWAIEPTPETTVGSRVSLSWTGPDDPGRPGVAPETDPRLIERLRALGYLD